MVAYRGKKRINAKIAERCMFTSTAPELYHFSNNENIDLDAFDGYDNSRQHIFKPNGLWLSDESDFGWSEWCSGNNFLIGANKFKVEVDLSKILHLRSIAEIKNFAYIYNTNDNPFVDGRQEIRWSVVAAEYSGVLITPYQWALRMELFWYYPWDCASGCVWNKDAIVNIERVL